jgi:G3E family GTPase
MTTLHAIPCNVITGFLGVGKTTCILNLLSQKPDEERWAILVNEFGEIGLDGQLLEHNSAQTPGVFIREVPGGCMCCASGVPMQIALNMLLMKAKPDRLLIEPTGLGHPKEVLKTLSGEHYKEVLTLENTITLVNPQHFSSEKHLQNATFQQQLGVADVIVINKTDLADAQDIENVRHYLSSSQTLNTVPYHLTKHGVLPLDLLKRKPGQSAGQKMDSAPSSKPLFSLRPQGRKQINTQMPDTLPALPACGYLLERHEDAGFTSVGWRIKDSLRLDLSKTLHWFASLKAIRIKALFHSDQGWVTVNFSKEAAATDRYKPGTKESEMDYQLVSAPANPESRMEMIFENTLFNEQELARWKVILQTPEGI